MFASRFQTGVARLRFLSRHQRGKSMDRGKLCREQRQPEAAQNAWCIFLLELSHTPAEQPLGTIRSEREKRSRHPCLARLYNTAPCQRQKPSWTASFTRKLHGDEDRVAHHCTHFLGKPSSADSSPGFQRATSWMRVARSTSLWVMARTRWVCSLTVTLA